MLRWPWRGTTRGMWRSAALPAWTLGGVAALALVLGACGGSGGDGAKPTTADRGNLTGTAGTGTIPANIGKNDKAEITAAGATFPAPVYQAWFDDYNKQVARGVRINYQSIGSGGGIQQFMEKTIDFGATDAPLSDAELAKAPDAQHIPMVVGAVVITYSLDGLTKPLQLDGPTTARIFLGDIKRWNDPAISALNPGVRLPDKDIQTVHRSDGSGTSFVFTDWLSKVSPDWKEKVGANKNPNWPSGQGAKGNEGVTNAIKQTPNSIGYIELNYATGNKLPVADVKNRAGKFVAPSLESISQAAGAAPLPDDYRASITDADGEASYPIASFTYLLVRKDAGCEKQRPIVNMLWWLFHDAGAARTAEELDYAPVPGPVVARVEATLRALTCDGRPILPG